MPGGFFYFRFGKRDILRKMGCKRHLLISTISLIVLAACGQTMREQAFTSPPPAERAVRVEACVDRSEYEGARDLGNEATMELRRQIGTSSVFTMSDEATLVVTCDVERMVEGSAIKRWIWPGWGVTKGSIAISLWRMPKQDVLASFHSHSDISGGGLYSLGAEHYILDRAIADVVEQLEDWVMGRNRGLRQEAARTRRGNERALS